MDDREKEITEEKILKISFGVLWTAMVAIISLGVWVGAIQNSVANVEARAERQSQAILRDRDENGARFEVLEVINNKLSRIEGILEEMRRKK